MYSKSVFLIINHVTRVAKGIATNKKGLANDPNNYETFENMIIADRVSKSNQVTASVIIDLLGGKVLKNRFDVDNTATFRDYVDRYQTEIGDALKRWGTQHPDNYKKLKGLTAIAEAEEVKNDTETNPYRRG